jgi:7-carboxy-7-deazaguanine synthase
MPTTDTQAAAAGRLRITEIFYSLQGEAATVGLPTVFIRLTGCPLRCGYCDTSYAFQGGAWMELDEILEQVASWKAAYVTVTGGEPLAQKPCALLLRQLCDAGYHVSLETSGALDVAPVDARVCKVMDLKTPGSGEVERNRMENIALLTPHDQVKFVICSREDYRWARAIVREYQLDSVCGVLFSPAHEQQNATELADWILQDRMPVRLQIQLHKILWGNEPGR